jgi:hypothetical protein
MLVVNVHQAGSATVDLQQHVWVVAVRARYPEAQGIVGGDFRMHSRSGWGLPYAFALKRSTSVCIRVR